MSTRRQAREWAVQMIFQLDANPTWEQKVEAFFEEFWNGSISTEIIEAADASHSNILPETMNERAFTPLRLGGRSDIPADEIPDEKTRTFSQNLVLGMLRHRTDIDKSITERLRNWKLSRIGSIERAVLRLGTYELVYESDDYPNLDQPPSAVVINEAVDLAKYFGTSESGRFVNGILDAIARKVRDRRSRSQTKPQIWSPADDMKKDADSTKA